MTIIMVAGPGLWVVSQLLLLLYFWLDNGANTCGIDFHFGNNKYKGSLKVEGSENEESQQEGINKNVSLNSRSSSISTFETEDASEEGLGSLSDKTEDGSKSIINDDELREGKYFEFKVLEELFISEFEVVSEEGR